MKATELRIGNYLQDREGRLCKVEELSSREGERGVYASAISGPTTGLPNRPIPLTEEWLLKKFGFEKYHNNLFVLGNISVHFYMLHEYYFISFNHRHIVLDNVHQLQNLYFALTGEELTI